MEFFKKLKERLFTLNVEESNKDNNKQIDVKYNKKLEQAKKKLDNKIKKGQAQRLKKENKVNKYIAGLEKTSSSFSKKILELKTAHNEINEEYFDDLEDLLIMADISVNLVMDIIDEIKTKVKLENISDPKLIGEIIADKLFSVYANNSFIDTDLQIKENRLNIILMVGVNGSGKTTTIGKIANKYFDEGKKILLAAGDTFRAGAVEQLSVWAKRTKSDIVVPKENATDPASVVYDALAKAEKDNYDILIIDTAGRLQNKVNLMKELKKINDIIQRKFPDAPHESLLVVDSTTGQNGVSQAMHFKDVTPITGLVLTKMDGTSKGGIVLTIKDKLNIPVKLMGLGEKISDIEEFDLDSFIYGMTKDLINDVD